MSGTLHDKLKLCRDVTSCSLVTFVNSKWYITGLQLLLNTNTPEIHWYLFQPHGMILKRDFKGMPLFDI